MSYEIERIFVAAIKEQEQFLDAPVDLSLGPESPLYGPDGQIDSLSLVTIITDVEKALLKQFGVRVRIASEHDLAVENSPFQTFGEAIGLVLDRIQASEQMASSVG